MGRWLFPVLKYCCLADFLAVAGVCYSSQMIGLMSWQQNWRPGVFCFSLLLVLRQQTGYSLPRPPPNSPPPPSLLPGPAETGLLWAHSDGHVSLAYACAGNLINAETSFRRGSCFRQSQGMLLFCFRQSHGMLLFCKK